ncbi:MAG TPA: helix-turn-helix domain-containing protein [Chloroflexia bacterium]|nr:helix-turn-helix domain-containing protein [Chloroflexia bacterium]
MAEGFQTEEYTEPDDKFEIDNLETLKAMADPQRLRIMEEMFEGPRTVKQIAAALDTTPTKLYYHIKVMEEHGLIRVVSTRVVSGIIEKLYHIRAYSFPINKSLMSMSESSGEEGFPTIISGVLGHTGDEIARGMKSGLIDLKKVSKEHRTFMMLHTLSKLSPQKAHDFITRFEALMTEFNDCSDSEANEPDARVYGLTVACYPTHHINLPTKSKKEEKEEKGNG